MPKSHLTDGIGSLPDSTPLERDWLTLGIFVAAIALFVATAAMVLPDMIASLLGGGDKPRIVLYNALLLNAALILLGWQRHTSLRKQLAAHRISAQEAKRLAELDDLTGALNRRSFALHLTGLLEDAAKSNEACAIAIVAIDVDNFKQINDLYGHAAGDSVLRETSRRIEAQLPKDGTVARLGGDEFVCAFPYHPASVDQVELIATHVIEQVALPVTVAMKPIDITVSVGISHSGQAEKAAVDEAAHELMHKADIAMYRAKKKGKNRFFWFEHAMENELRLRNELETGIRRGVDNFEFVPYYEQQIDLDSGRLAGFEMLARWHSPDRGLVSPEVFIPIAEQTGVIEKLSESLIEQAMIDASQWDPALTLSVNVSPVQMRDPWFAQKILKLLVKHRFPASRLDIEITESCLHENPGLVRSMITSLRNQGVQVTLDDFGTGYASLSQLKTLTFDRLKIDRSFIDRLEDEDRGVKLMEAIVSLSKELDIPITAEGIENAEILASLTKWERMKGQGYHYGRPEPAAKVLQRLKLMGRLAPNAGEAQAAVFSEVATTSGEAQDSEANAG